MALLLSFGIDTFLYNVAYLLAPGFGAVRNQERIIYLFSLAVSVLAGYGALTLVQPISRPARRGFRRLSRGLGWALVVLLGVTALFYAGYMQGLQQGVQVNLFEGALRHHALLLMILAGSAALFALRLSGRARRWRMALALGLIWLNLFTVNWQFNLAEPPSQQAFATTGLVDFLKQQGGTFRISSAGLLPGGPSAGIVYELEDITANTPLRLEAFQQIEDEVGDWRRWQLLNVQYVVAKRDLDGQGLERVYEEGKVKVYRVGDPLPRAWVVYQAVAAGDDQALAMLDAADFDPRTVAVVPQPTAADAAGSGRTRGSCDSRRSQARTPGARRDSRPRWAAGDQPAFLSRLAGAGRSPEGIDLPRRLYASGRAGRGRHPSRGIELSPAAAADDRQPGGRRWLPRRPADYRSPSED